MKYSLLILIMMLTPIVAVSGYTDDAPYVAVRPDAIDSDVGVLAGDTLKWNIDQLTIPGSPDNVTLPDFAGNQIYMKILHVDNSYILPEGTGTYVTFAVGLLFLQTETITLFEGFGVLEQNIVIPAGAATPSMTLAANPSFNDSDYSPTVFFVNDDWTAHETFFTNLGMTVTNGATNFEVEFINGTGTVEGTWRKSDGVLTHLLFDDIYMGGMDMTGITIELNLASKEYKPLAVTAGQIIDLKGDVMDFEVTGSGDLYNTINQTVLTEIQDELALMEDEVLLRFVVEEVDGCYAKGIGYAWDMNTHTLGSSSGSVVFNGFFGSIQSTEPPLWTSGDSYLGGYWAPALTPDWDIYAGQMMLADYGISTYINDYLLATAPPEEDVTINNVAGSFELTTKRAFKFFQFGLTGDVNINISSGIMPPAVYDEGVHIIAEIEGYSGFHETGIACSIRFTGLASYEIYAPGTVTAPTGSITVEFDFKLVNPNYNPPDPIGRGFIPGFTWAIAIPALIGVAAFALFARKRK
ncbi:MAG: hypothetical protein ACTSXA_11775 [Candidatus Heimdallarchaeota archaeon]